LFPLDYQLKKTSENSKSTADNALQNTVSTITANTMATAKTTLITTSKQFATSLTPDRIRDKIGEMEN
ncbi:unnamed protein product, partial [Rotaria sp. Silwood2]